MLDERAVCYATLYADHAARLTNSQQRCSFQAMANRSAHLEPRRDDLIAGLDLLHSRQRKTWKSLVRRSSFQPAMLPIYRILPSQLH